MKIKVKNYGLVRNADIEFLPGLNVIRGESGSGKSTVIRGIEGAIFNQSGDSFVTQGEDSASILIDYNNHSICRERNKKESKYIIDGVELLKVGKTPVKEVLNAFGIKEIKSDGADIRPNFLSQFSTPFLVDERPSKIFEYLTITSNITNLKSVEDEITNDLSSLKTQKKCAEDILSTLKKVILSSSKIIEYKNDIRKLVDELHCYETKKDKLNSLLNIVYKIKEVNEKLVYTKEKIDYLEKILNDIYSLNIDYKKLHEKIMNINRVENILNTISELKDSYQCFENKIMYCEKNKISINREKIEGYIEKIKKLQLVVNSCAEKKDNISYITSMGVKEKNNLNIISSDVCKFRESNVPIIVIDTNMNLESSLNISRSDIIDILSNK